jgi:hypothetical protein
MLLRHYLASNGHAPAFVPFTDPSVCSQQYTNDIPEPADCDELCGNTSACTIWTYAAAQPGALFVCARCHSKGLLFAVLCAAIWDSCVATPARAPYGPMQQHSQVRFLFVPYATASAGCLMCLFAATCNVLCANTSACSIWTYAAAQPGALDAKIRINIAICHSKCPLSPAELHDWYVCQNQCLHHMDLCGSTARCALRCVPYATARARCSMCCLLLLVMSCVPTPAPAPYGRMQQHNLTVHQPLRTVRIVLAAVQRRAQQLLVAALAAGCQLQRVLCSRQQ